MRESASVDVYLSEFMPLRTLYRNTPGGYMVVRVRDEPLERERGTPTCPIPPLDLAAAITITVRSPPKDAQISSPHPRRNSHNAP
ncbi:hypothetical protein MIC448_500009 [Microbacterium sp. C448]|nr:hypothetical protein MIC448_500009 [Microbacterium sp. C448]